MVGGGEIWRAKEREERKMKGRLGVEEGKDSDPKEKALPHISNSITWHL